MVKGYGSNRLRTWWEYLHTSFWFVPGMMAFGAVLLLLAARHYDAHLESAADAAVPWFVYQSAPEDARDVLSTLLSSMITMATLVFSITMVVLTLAAAQFGPRLIRSFMATPHTQLVLGTFVMTIAYCLMVLFFIGRRTGGGPYPYLTVSIAMGLALASVGLLVLFLHTLARSIVSETVIERVGRELDELLDDFELISENAAVEPVSPLPEQPEARASFFGVSKAGYVQAVEFESLAAAAKEADTTLVLHFRPGDYLAVDGRSIAVYPHDRLTDELVRAVDRAIVTGSHRTPVQDPEFSIRHLVEIAVRALSPGINDPYTAVAVVGRLSASLSQLMRRSLPTGSVRDCSGTVRVTYQAPSYGTLVSAAFDQIRQNGVDKPLVAIHLLQAVERIAEHVRLPVQHHVLGEQLQIIAEAAKRMIPDPSDRADIVKRAEATRRALDRVERYITGKPAGDWAP